MELKRKMAEEERFKEEQKGRVALLKKMAEEEAKKEIASE